VSVVANVLNANSQLTGCIGLFRLKREQAERQTESEQTDELSV
jgi:hypothetical protein